MMSAVHLSAMRSRTNREGHCAYITEGGEEALAMILVFTPLAGRCKQGVTLLLACMPLHRGIDCKAPGSMFSYAEEWAVDGGNFTG